MHLLIASTSDPSLLKHHDGKTWHFSIEKARQKYQNYNNDKYTKQWRVEVELHDCALVHSVIQFTRYFLYHEKVHVKSTWPEEKVVET